MRPTPAGCGPGRPNMSAARSASWTVRWPRSNVADRRAVGVGVSCPLLRHYSATTLPAATRSARTWFAGRDGADRPRRRRARAALHRSGPRPGLVEHGCAPGGVAREGPLRRHRRRHRRAGNARRGPRAAGPARPRRRRGGRAAHPSRARPSRAAAAGHSVAGRAGPRLGRRRAAVPARPPRLPVRAGRRRPRRAHRRRAARASRRGRAWARTASPARPRWPRCAAPRRARSCASRRRWASRRPTASARAAPCSTPDRTTRPRSAPPSGRPAGAA